MNLGHGRAGHLPDYCFIKYKYLPAWGEYEEIIKDNPSDYLHAFCQMIYAMKYLRGEIDSFNLDEYAWDAIEPYKEEIERILHTRQADASKDWKALGEKISGCEIPPFDIKQYQEEYRAAATAEKNSTFLGKFFIAAMSQKSMVTNRIFQSGNKLAGYSVEYNKKGFRGIKDFRMLINQNKGGTGS